MSVLTVEGYEVNALVGTRKGVQKFGDVGPAFSGRMRSDIRATHRSYDIRLAPVDDTGRLALETILRSPGAVKLGGTEIGDDADFHIRGLTVEPHSNSLWSISFQARETTDYPSALLFSFDADAVGPNTSTRSGAVGPFVDSDGVLQNAAADVLRTDWIDTDGDGILDTPTTLVEAARTNIVSSDVVSSWAVSGTPVVTGSVSDPAGGTGAYSVEDDDGAVAEDVHRAWGAATFTDAAPASFVFVVRENVMPATGSQSLVVRDVTAGADRLGLSIMGWTDGEPQITAVTGTHLQSRLIGNGYWAVYGRSTNLTAANTHWGRVFPGNASDTGIIDLYRMNAYDDKVPSHSILDASETRNADTLYGDLAAAPQEMTAYAKIIAHGAADISSGGVFHIGAAGSSTDPRFQLRGNGSGVYALLYDDGVASPLIATLGAGPSYGDTVELRCVLASSGASITLGQSINGATETTASASGASAIATAWAGTRLYIGSLGSSFQGMDGIVALKIAGGTKTMAEMRDLARGRLWQRTA